MRTLFSAICLSVLPAMAADVYTLSVLGPETVSGPPGAPALTGWGYSIQNQSSTNWLVTTDLTAGLFLHATPEALFDFPDVAPGATATVLYDPVPPASGLYQIVWDEDAPAGFVNSGTFTLNAQWWSGDPLAGGNFLSSAPSISQPYTTTIVPEPGSGNILALSILLFGVTALFRRPSGRSIAAAKSM
ncbi:MAG TPA: hypothetical protein VK604_04605 [Bryobacteraceae bacterium]|nr:hypothetical protein [Bryobacteraceae bacterium]HTF69003.1 hypothetical protein [Edaphobacter sp.]